MLKWLDSLRRPPSNTVSGFIYVMIPMSIMPVERGDQFEDPMDAELQRQGLGYVSGGGSSLSEPDDEGRRTIVHCGVDVEADDLERARALLRAMLPDLGAPPLTTVEYEVSGERREDRYFDGSWKLGIPRIGYSGGLSH